MKMKTEIAILVLAWIGGIVYGVVPGAWVVGLVIILVGMCLSKNLNKKMVPMITAVILLAAMGYVYGYRSNELVKATGCRSNDVMVSGAVINREVRVKNVRYVVMNKEGCKVYVYADRFPIYNIGSEISWESSSNFEDVNMIREDNPGYADYLVGEGIDRVIYYPKIVLREQNKSYWKEMRWWAATQISLRLPEPDASLAKAMWLAEKGEVPTGVKDVLQTTGVGHIMAISGLHVGIVAGIILVSIQLFPWRRSAQAISAILLLWTYIIFVGAPISAVRAAAFWSLSILGLISQRLLGWMTIFVIAGVIILSVNPLMIKSVGMQLSFAAVTGIFGTIFLTRTSKIQKRGRGFLVAVGAWITTWPIMAYHFGVFAWVSLIANVVIVPAVPIFLISVLLTLIGHQIYSPFGMLLSFGVHVMYKWIVGMAMLLQQLPGAVWDVTITSRQIGAYYCCLLAVAIGIMKYQKRSWREIWI